MCGVLGVIGSITLGQGRILLQMLTHRGQDASGLAWLEGTNNEIKISKKNTYPDLLDIDEEKKVSMLIGSTRYPTFGNRTNSLDIEHYAQPFCYETKYGKLTLVHNGNITNIPILTDKNYESDSHFIVEFLGELLNDHE